MTDQELKDLVASLAVSQKETDRRLDRLGEQLGFWGRSLGDVVELTVVPGILRKMSSFGHCFTRVGPKKVYYKNDKTLTEIDLMLENGEEAMAVEVKTSLSVKWVNSHLKRLSLLRKNESITGLKNRTLYAAVAGISIDKEARELALESGMYVISLKENSDRLNIAAPKKNKIGRW